jgi:hypothetical protein
MKVFPILYQGITRKPDWPVAVSWGEIEFYEAQIVKHHYQSIASIAKRGGLSPVELYAAMKGIDILAKADLPESDAKAMEAMLKWGKEWIYGRNKQ